MGSSDPAYFFAHRVLPMMVYQDPAKLAKFVSDVCLLEQPYAKDDKQSVAQIIGDANIVRFAQVEIG